MRTVHGIKEDDLRDAPTYEQIRPVILSHLQGKIVVGHALWNDLSWLNYRLPYDDMRDTALYYPLRKALGIKRESDQGSLKKLAKAVLDLDVQKDVHCPVSQADP